ncbi:MULTISPECIES: hypothetical protein [Actinomadura]|uniref:LPXTG cell wall anchor domain-containing protein n=1 Tax=Actinomadura yumaensis TaxID=111807 RepID=A0ABW2CFT0_9ACTN|nr:hypothetical protein [Actinomadura sp. J1-007]
MEELLRVLVAGAIGGGLIGVAGVLGQSRRKRREERRRQGRS